MVDDAKPVKRKSEEKTVKLSDDSKLKAALAYLFGIVTGLIIYLIEEKDKYARFHAVQSMLLCVAAIVIFFGLGLISIIITLLPFIGPIIAFFIVILELILGVGVFGLWIFMMYKAYSGVKYKLPIIGDMAEKHA